MSDPQLHTARVGPSNDEPMRRGSFWRALRGGVALQSTVGRFALTALLGTTILSGCFLINGSLYIGDVNYGKLSRSALGLSASSTAHHVSRAKDLTAGSYALSSSTPYLPFAGNRLLVISPSGGGSIPSAILQRAANCSLTETVIQPVNGMYDTRQTLDLPNAQDYLHQLSGLTTQPDVFPQGCADTQRGKRSVFTAQPVSVTSTMIRSVDVNPTSEQLEVQTIDRAANTLTTTTLTSGRVQSFSVVDVNGDGLPDIVAAGVGYGAGVTGNVVVFVNNGNGTFRTAATIANAGSAFVVDDVNGDGKPDIVIDNGYDANGTQIPGVSTLLGNGDGTFRTAVASAPTVTNVFGGPLVTGDFNGDGKPDLLLSSQVLLGNGDGTFTVGPALPAGVQPSFYGAVGDFNHDGKLDAVYTGFGYVQVLLGNGDGTFNVGMRYASTASQQPVAVSEIDGDGNLDIVVGNASQGVFVPVLDNFLQRIQVLLGRGDGTFTAAPVYVGDIAQNSSATQFATADFDSDGKLDALVIDNAISAGLDVLPGDGHGAFGSAVHSATTVRASMVVAADLDGDGKPDAVAAGQDASALPIVATLVNQGGGRFAVEHDYALPNYPTAIAVGDFDGDGHMDVVVALGTSLYSTTGPLGVYVLYGKADGTLTAPVQIDTSTQAISVAVADVDGDGRADIAIADAGPPGGTGAVHVYLGRADRTFTATTVPSTTATVYSVVAFGDVNADGKPDLLVGGSVPGATFGAMTPNLYTFIGNGDGTFQTAQTEPLLGTDASANAIAVADFNNDGHLDVAIGNQEDYTEVLLGQGNGTYAHGLLAIGEHPNAIVAADLDNDHYAELLIAVAGSGIATFKNAGTVAAWTLPTATTPPTGPTTPTPPATGDFTVAATPTNGSIMAGQAVQTLIALAPTGGFAGSVTLSCSSGLPVGATCSFSPGGVTLSGTTAGSSSLTITTHAATALGSIMPIDGGWPQGVMVTLFGSTALWLRRRRPRWAAGIGLLTIVGVLASCGGDDGSKAVAPPATATTYPITITAASSATTHTVTYQLTLH